VSEADVNQQVAVIENSTEVVSANVSGVNAPTVPGGRWAFNITLTMAQSVFAATYGAAPATQ